MSGWDPHPPQQLQRERHGSDAISPDMDRSGLWPLLLSMQYAQDFDPGASSVNPVDDNERGRGDDQFAGSAPPPDSSGRGIVAQEDVRALPDGERHRQCALRAFLLDKVEDAVEVGDGGVKPDDGNTQASRP